jgi:hypothetical protein
MKTSLLLAAIIFLNLSSNAQILTSFSWDGPLAAVGKADQGPNAISTSSSAIASIINVVGGVTNYGVSPGTATDINITLPNTTYFNVPSLDIAIDFRREESEASFISRSSGFDFGMSGGKLSVKFTLDNGMGGTVTVNSGNVFDIPNDHLFHNYRFMYDNTTGIGNIWVDGVVKYSYNGTPNRALYWNGGSPVIGKKMDATGTNVAVLDNFSMRIVSLALVLPVKFNSFTAIAKTSGVELKWSTLNESSVKAFVVEKSIDGVNFFSVKSIASKGSNSLVNEYESVDALSLSNVSYRIRSLDNDGKSTYSRVKTISGGPANASAEISYYPNPATNLINLKFYNAEVEDYTYSIYTQDGRKIMSAATSIEKGYSNIAIPLGSNVPHNSILIVIIENNKTAVKATARIFRK